MNSSLPAPTGPFPVGRVPSDWRGTVERAGDGDEPDLVPRELVGWIWYPAAPGPDAEPAAYLPPGWEALGQLWGFDPAQACSHAYEAVPVTNDPVRFPVLLFSPAGFPPLCLAAIVEEIVSHGFVVIGVNHTDESAVTVLPDGRVVPMDAAWMQPVLGPFDGPPERTLRARAAIAEAKAADLELVMNRLVGLDAGTGPQAQTLAGRMAGRLDLDRIGVFGHSLGGNAALELARTDARCKAVANLDGGIWSSVGTLGIDRPNLLMLADHPEMTEPCADVAERGVYPSVAWCEAERTQNFGAWRTLYERGQPGYAASVAGSGHISFLDVPFLPIAPGSAMAGGLAGVSIDSVRAWRVICDYLLAFFRRHLGDASGAAAPAEPSPLDGPSAAYPEVRVGSPPELLTGRDASS
ncbi:MAG: hypothetical protein U0893_00840 [Chloroflexota bacterium]